MFSSVASLHSCLFYGILDKNTGVLTCQYLSHIYLELRINSEKYSYYVDWIGEENLFVIKPFDPVSQFYSEGVFVFRRDKLITNRKDKASTDRATN